MLSWACKCLISSHQVSNKTGSYAEACYWHHGLYTVQKTWLERHTWRSSTANDFSFHFSAESKFLTSTDIHLIKMTCFLKIKGVVLFEHLFSLNWSLGQLLIHGKGGIIQCLLHSVGTSIFLRLKVPLHVLTAVRPGLPSRQCCQGPGSSTQWRGHSWGHNIFQGAWYGAW